VTEVIDDGIGQLTFVGPSGESFLHVGMADGDITVGCSTRMSLSDCLVIVSRVASAFPELLESMAGGVAHATWEAHDMVHGREELVSLPEDWQFGAGLADRVMKSIPEEVAVTRIDIGNSSWQWDDFPRTGTRSFGGLLHQSLINALANVVASVGDDWVRANFEDHALRINDFLVKHLGREPQ
jgi:hypothetical protein